MKFHVVDSEASIQIGNWIVELLHEGDDLGLRRTRLVGRADEFDAAIAILRRTTLAKSGISTLQGTHQVAQKLTTTTLPLRSVRAAFLARDVLQCKLRRGRALVFRNQDVLRRPRRTMTGRARESARTRRIPAESE